MRIKSCALQSYIRCPTITILSMSFIRSPKKPLCPTKSHGPITVPTGCVLSVPTASTPSNSFSLHFSYEQVAFHILETSSQEELAKYHHQTVGSPPRSSFLRSIQDYSSQWKTFPGLSYELIRSYLPPSIATYQGHMIRKQSGTNSTRGNRHKILNARKDVQDMFST